MRHLLLSLIGIMFVVGCGQSSETATSTTQDNKKIVPQVRTVNPSLDGAWYIAKVNDDGSWIRMWIQKDGREILIYNNKMVVNSYDISTEIETRYKLTGNKLSDKIIEVPKQKVMFNNKEEREIEAQRIKWIDEDTIEIEQGSTKHSYVSKKPAYPQLANQLSNKPASSTTENNQSTTAPNNTGAIMQKPFLGMWWAKKPSEGFVSNTLELKSDNTFHFVSSDKDGPQVQMYGTWKVTSVKSLQIHNDSLNGTGLEKATARLLDAETLELDTFGKKELYLRRPVSR